MLENPNVYEVILAVFAPMENCEKINYLNKTNK